MKYYIIKSDIRPDGYVHLSDSRSWRRWINRNIPGNIDQSIKNRLKSNLSHIIVGLEIKKALIDSHKKRELGEREVLFEPYFQSMIFEFCVGAFSVFEGLGSVHWLDQNGKNGADSKFIKRTDWLPALCDIYDSNQMHDLGNNVEKTRTVRDKLHQDNLGVRNKIDWHALTYDAAFLPTLNAVRTLLMREKNFVPCTTNFQC